MPFSLPCPRGQEIAMCYSNQDHALKISVLPKIKNKKRETEKKTRRDKFLFDLFEADCYTQGLVFQSRGLPKRGQTS